jgi:hypothetical protein
MSIYTPSRNDALSFESVKNIDDFAANPCSTTTE